MIQKIKILMADGDSETNKLFGSMLSQAGYDVTYVEDGREALHFIHAQEFKNILVHDLESELCSAEAAKALAKYYKKHRPHITVTGKDTSPGLLSQLGIDEQAINHGCFKTLSNAIKKAAMISMPACQIDM